MEPTTLESKQNISSTLEAQIRECFGRVVYTHKTHEKTADLYLRRLHRLKLAQIIISAITTGALLYALFGNNQIGTIIGALLSAGLFALNAYTKDYDLGELAQKHKDTANRLWGIRESYLSLLTDMAGGVLSTTEAQTRRDDLQQSLEFVYNSAPRTLDEAYEQARTALKEKEEFTFTDNEIDQFVPSSLRRGKGGQPTKT